jgi:hypothetical protein
LYSTETGKGNRAVILEAVATAVALAAVGLIVAYTLVTGTPPMPTSGKVKAAMMGLLPADPEGVIHELGSGWGTLAFALARRFPGHSVVACELSPVPWLVSRARHLAAPVPNLTLRRADLHEADLGDAGLVVCYLVPEGMEKLRPKLEAELKPGAWVLSNTFALRGWRAHREEAVGDLFRTTVYLYRVPAPGGVT